MNSVIKKIFINFFVILLLFLFADFVVFHIMSGKENNSKIYPFNYMSAYTYMPISKFKMWFEEYKKYSLSENFSIPKGSVLETNIQFRNASIVNSNKSPILLLGCSFTWGANLEENQVFNAKLSEYSNRSVYNVAIPGWSVQQSLYMLQNSLLETLDIKPEYVIYTFIPDHLNRANIPCSFFENSFVFYKDVDGRLVLKTDKEILYWHSYISRFLYFKKNDYEAADNMPKYTKLFLKHLLEVNKLIKEHSPSSTFVVFVYEDKGAIMSLRSELEKNGIKVIFLNELSSIDIYAKENINDDVGHPSAKVWEEIAPLLAQKLNL